MAEAEAKQNVGVGENVYIRLLKQILDKLKIDPLPVAYQLRCLDGLDHWTATAQWSGGEGYDEKSFRCFGRTKIESHGNLCKEAIEWMWSAGFLACADTNPDTLEVWTRRGKAKKSGSGHRNRSKEELIQK